MIAPPGSALARSASLLLHDESAGYRDGFVVRVEEVAGATVVLNLCLRHPFFDDVPVGIVERDLTMQPCKAAVHVLCEVIPRTTSGEAEQRATGNGGSRCHFEFGHYFHGHLFVQVDVA